MLLAKDAATFCMMALNSGPQTRLYTSMTENARNVKKLSFVPIDVNVKPTK